MVIAPNNKHVQPIESVIDRTLAMETTTQAEREALLDMKAQIEHEKNRSPYLTWANRQKELRP